MDVINNSAQLNSITNKLYFEDSVNLNEGILFNYKNDDNYKSISFCLEKNISQKLLKLCNDSDLNTLVILIANLTTVLNIYRNNKEFIITTRNVISENQSGIIPIKIDVDENTLFKDLLINIRNLIIEYKDNNDSKSYEEIGIVYNGSSQLAHGGEKKCNIIFKFYKEDNIFKCVCEYNSTFYQKIHIERIILHFNNSLNQTLENTRININAVDIIDSEEKQVILNKYSKGDNTASDIYTIHSLFESQLVGCLNNVAIKYYDLHITYGELNKRANTLSDILIKKGCKVGTIIAIMLHSSPEMIIAMLAVLKAGGAYLPIDPELPDARISKYLKDSNSSFLISNSSQFAKHSITQLNGINETKIEPYLTQKRENIKDFDSLPFIDRSLIDYEKYLPCNGMAIVKYNISIQATRGCPYKCVYCFKIWSNCHVFRSAQNIFDEVKRYYDLGIKRFVIVDDVFNLNRENSIKFFELIIENKLDINLYFPSGLRADLLTEEYIDLMVKAGTIFFGLALETASPRLQKLIKKNLKIEKLRNIAEYVCKKYPYVILELYTMHGFPTETEKEAIQTLEFIKSFKWLHFPYVHVLKIFPGTEMEQLALDSGISRDNIIKNVNIAYHTLPSTLPFEKSFSLKYQSDFLKDYFLNRERLLHVLPNQMKSLTEDEIVLKYNSYLPVKISSFDELLEVLEISKDKLGDCKFYQHNHVDIKNFKERVKEYFPKKKVEKKAIRILLLDLSLYFSYDSENMLYDHVEPPMGLMYLLTYLNDKIGEKVDGKIAKSRVDFDNFNELRELIHNFKPDVIGVRTLTFYKDFFHLTISKIRQWGINIPIIVGGPYATSEYKAVLQDQNINILVLGEGEITFYEVIQAMIRNNNLLPDNNSLRAIKGLAFIDNKKLINKSFNEIILIDDIPNKDLEVKIREIESNNVAYLIYTSGTTGNPKGILVQHNNAINVLRWFGKRYGIKKGTHVVQLTNNSFDPSVEQIFGTLLHGATLHVIDSKKKLNYKFLRDYITTNEINVINSIPRYLKEILPTNKTLGKLKTVISGGERLDEKTKDYFLNAGYELYNHYGPTETTIESLTSKCCITKKVSLGQPIDNTYCYVLTPFGNLTPIGVSGLLHITGRGLTRGYLNNPELTHEKYVYKPTLNNERLFVTGDRAYIDENGDYYYLNRIDDQIKIRGFRVELTEIEQNLLKHEHVKQAIVLHDQRIEDGIIIGFVRLHDQKIKIKPSDFRAYLLGLIPDYMVPSRILILDHFPYNLSGKINTADLLKIANERFNEIEYVPPTSDIESRLVKIWENVIGGKVGLHDNFFNIGGDSIKAIQISSKLQSEGYKFEMKYLFENPTISGLISFIEHSKNNIEQSIVTGDVNLSPIQTWFFNSEIEEKHFFNQSVLVEFKKPISEKVIKEIICKLHQHHDTLRICFPKLNATVRQCIKDVDEPYSFKSIDLRDSNNPDEIVYQTATYIQANINLEDGPLIEWVYFNLKNKNRLLIIVHHLIIDTFSWRILLEDIETLFNQHEEGIEYVLPLKTNSFKFWTEKLGELANSSLFLKEKEFWKGVINKKITQIQTDFISENYIKDQEYKLISLDENLTESLLKNSNEAYGTEINDLLLTALGLSVKSQFNVDELFVELEGHGREEIIPDVNISRTVGWFTSIFPILLDFSDSGSISDQIIRVKELLHSIPDKGIGYGILKYLTFQRNKEDVDFSIQPQISFNYLGSFDNNMDSNVFKVIDESYGNSLGKKGKLGQDIAITVLLKKKMLTVIVRYSKEKFKSATISNFLKDYLLNLEQVILHCSCQESTTITPSDLSYNELSMDELDSIFD